MNILVRRPCSDDLPQLAAHFAEMQEHYGRPVTQAQAHEAATIAGRPRMTMFDPHVLLATVDDQIAGSVVLNVSFPAYELTRSLYIRDLYVARAVRRGGIGRALVRASARLAAENGYSALEWTTDSGNLGARSMYEACGAKLLGRSYYRVFGAELITASSDATTESHIESACYAHPL